MQKKEENSKRQKTPGKVQKRQENSWKREDMTAKSTEKTRNIARSKRKEKDTHTHPKLRLHHPMVAVYVWSPNRSRKLLQCRLVRFISEDFCYVTGTKLNHTILLSFLLLLLNWWVKTLLSALGIGLKVFTPIFHPRRFIPCLSYIASK